MGSTTLTANDHVHEWERIEPEFTAAKTEYFACSCGAMKSTSLIYGNFIYVPSVSTTDSVNIWITTK